MSFLDSPACTSFAWRREHLYGVVPSIQQRLENTSWPGNQSMISFSLSDNMRLANGCLSVSQSSDRDGGRYYVLGCQLAIKPVWLPERTFATKVLVKRAANAIFALKAYCSSVRRHSALLVTAE